MNWWIPSVNNCFSRLGLARLQRNKKLAGDDAAPLMADVWIDVATVYSASLTTEKNIDRETGRLHNIASHAPGAASETRMKSRVLKSTTRHHSIVLYRFRRIAVALLIAATTWQCVQPAAKDRNSAHEPGIAKLDRDNELRRQRAAAPNAEGSLARAVPIIDIHAHLDVMTGRRADYTGAAETALETMDQHGIRTAVLMSPPLPPGHPRPQDYRELLAVARKFPGRFLVLGGGAALNPLIQEAGQQNNLDAKLRQRFMDTAEAMLAEGVAGFGELTSLHFSFNSTHPFEMVPPDHALFLLLADVAARHGVPIDFHMEAVHEEMAVPQQLRDRSASNPARIPENIKPFERLLAHNRKATIIWQHAGWDNTGSRSVQLMGRLLGDHPNLFLGLKMSPLSVFKENDPVQRGAGLRPEWRALIANYPDRFMLGSDYFAPAPNFNRRRPPNLQPALRVIELLPPALKPKVAHENAQRLYRLNGVSK